MKNYVSMAHEWGHREFWDAEDEEFGYVSGENEPTQAEKIAFDLYRDLSGRKGILDGIDQDILNNMIEDHIGIIKENLE